MGGTAGFFLILATATLATWHAVQPVKATPEPLVVSLQPLAAPQETVQEVPEGPERIEQKEQKPTEREERPEPPKILTPQLSRDAPPARQPVEPSRVAEQVPETTAPKSIPAPPAQRASSDAEATWEATLLAHLEKYRRYPAAARARREQGVAHVRFRMNRQGQLLSAQILRSSGSALLDRAALDTLRRAQPLPAIPASKADPLELSVPVEFFTRR